MIERRSLLPAAALLFKPGRAAALDPSYSAAQEQLAATVDRKAMERGYGVGRRLSPAVRKAIRATPRHLFVPASVRDRAYEDRPLSIGHGATISQPFIVALMTDLLRTEPDAIVLEVGTGSGYQAAVLSPLVRHVYSIEIVAPLAQSAAARLRTLGYANVTVRAGDGYAGWPEHAPYDGIIVTAGATHVPRPLIDQLKPGGRMVIPVGSKADGQELTVVEKDRGGRVHTAEVLSVLFVPLDERARPPK